MCEKLNLEKPEKGYLQNPQMVTENINHKLIWEGMNMQCDNVTVERKPDIVIVNEMEKTAIIMDVAIPGIKRIIDNKRKRLKIISLRREIQRLWNRKKIVVILLVFRALGSVTKNFEKYVDKVGIKIDLHAAQNTTL